MLQGGLHNRERNTLRRVGRGPSLEREELSFAFPN